MKVFKSHVRKVLNQIVLNRGYRIALEQLEATMKDQELIASYEDYLENVTDGNEQAAAIMVLASIAARLVSPTKEEVSKAESKKD